MGERATRTLNLEAMPGELAICRLPADAASPGWAVGPFVSISRTSDELSVVCAAENVPADVQADRNWSGFKLAGPFAFDEIGVLAAIAEPLAAAEIGIFVISTFDTDYLLVPTKDRGETAAVLSAAGHSVDNVALERSA